MSHFTVAVIGSNVEEQLAPFNENVSEGNEEYREFEDHEKKCQKDWKSGKTDAILMPDKTYKSPYDAQFRDKSKGFSNDYVYPKGSKKVKVSYKKLYKDFDTFCEEYHGYRKNEETGNHGYWHNPNAKWDWYQVGGRWSGFLKLKKGKNGNMGEKSWCNEKEEIPEDRVDQAKKGDIDFDGMKSESFEKANKSYDEFEKLLAQDPEKAKNNAYWEYGIQNVSGKAIDKKWIPETREQYLKRCAAPTTFAVLKDGKWYQRGEMGWWACVSNEKDGEKWTEEFWKLLQSVDNNEVISIVDCHI
jgi:hypothetical protein